MTRPYVSVLLFVAAAGCAPLAAPIHAIEPVAFALDSRGGIRLPIEMGDGTSLVFLLDTGSNRTAISEAAARQLQLPVVAQTSVVSAGGTDLRSVVRLPVVRLGTVRKSGLLATVHASSQLRSLAGDVDGILGQDFLLDQHYTIDYRRRVVTWTESSAGKRPAHTIRLQTRNSEGRCLVALPQQDGREPLWFVPDSGADVLVLFGATDTPIIRSSPLPGRFTLAGLGGQRPAQPIVLSELRVGDATLRDLPALHLRRDPRGAPDGDGLLPLRLFSEVSFDGPSQAMEVVVR